jgi:hypothetical protein
MVLIAGGEAWGQGTPKPKLTPQQLPPGGPKMPTLPDLVVLKFHYSTHVCNHWGQGKSGYRGWFEVKNQGPGAAVFESTHKYVGIYFQGKMIAYSIYQVDNSPLISGTLGETDLYFSQPSGSPPYAMTARVGPDDLVQEIAEANNALSFVITQDARALCGTPTRPPPPSSGKPVPKP